MEIPTPTKSIDKQLFNSGCTIIKCGQLIDGRGNVPIKDGIIIIKDDTIIYVSDIAVVRRYFQLTFLKR